MLDFAAYLGRIGLAAGASPSWKAIHRAHVTTIPFENIDSHRGIPVSLAQPDLERKLVTQRRGGYCFEHNLLLASAIEHLGHTVEPMLARVRVGGAPADSRPAGHLVLRVTDGDGEVWLADVGFGLGTLLDPIPFRPDPAAVHEQSGWHFRLVEDDHGVVLQTLSPEGWSDVYGFVAHAAPRIDIEVNNWWICTNPASPFVSGLIAAVNHADGRREAIVDWSGPLVAMAMSPRSTETAPLARTMIPAKLEQFGLPGFTLGEDGRVQ